MQFPDTDVDMAKLHTPSMIALQPECSTPSSRPTAFSTSSYLNAEQDVSINVGLPSTYILNELVNVFFSDLYHIFPCFHKASFMEGLRTERLQTEAPVLLYAMCTVAAGFHPDPAIKAQQNNWHEQAKFLYELTGRDSHPGLLTIQAVLCLIFHSYTK